MYNDLPSINVVHRESSEPLDGQWSMTLRQHYSGWHRELGAIPSWSNGRAQQIPLMDGPIYQDHFKVSSWLPLAVKQDSLGSQHPYSFEDFETRAWKPWSATRTRIRSNAEESPGSDQASLGSSWNPEGVEDHSDYKAMGEEHLTALKRGLVTLDSWSCRVPSREYVHPVPAITNTGIERPDPGVTLQDVQHIPDEYATNSDDGSISATECNEQGMLVGCGSITANTMSNTHPSLSSQESERSLDDELQDSCSRTCNLNRTSYNDESDDDSEYQDRPSRTSRRCTERKVKPSKASKNPEKLAMLSTSRVSKRRSRQVPKQATNNTAMSERSMRSPCSDCKFEAASKSALRKHTLTVHIRPFTCSFRIYGCPATFGSKNEWKRHVSSQHLRLGFWRCDLDGCLPSGGPQSKLPGSANGSTRACSEEVVTYNDFNRKDLFTQHLRRMHAPGHGASKTNRDSFDLSLAATCTRCWVSLRSPPVFRTCGFCDEDEPFMGDDRGKVATWETRMEHVGRHLEIGHGQSRIWHEDMVLRDWMAENDLIQQGKNGAWTLTSLQRGKGKVTKIAA